MSIHPTKSDELTSDWFCMEVSTSLTEGSSGSTPGSCGTKNVLIITCRERTGHEIPMFLTRAGGNNYCNFSRHTDARMEDTKAWSANNWLMSLWLGASFVPSCMDN